MPVPATNDAFLDMLAKSNLVEQDTIAGALEGQSDFAAPNRLAAYLVKKGVLTKYQAEQLLMGRIANLYLGKYKILELLGRGGMGAVFLCEHITMRRRVALKVLANAKTRDASLVDRFHREARAVGALNHPNIVQAYDVDSVGKTHYLVMEYVEGINLFDLVRKVGPLAIPRAANYLAQAADGLQHAFEAGLVHRDIKPPNLLLSRQGVVKVLDMGLALFFKDDSDHLTAKFDSTTVLGTVDYLAPEQSMDSHGVDIRADIYSLGATLYFLLTGKTPFGDVPLAQKLVMLNMREPTPIRQLREEVPAELAAVITKLLAKAPEDRYQTPAEVSAALAPWASQFDVGAEDETLIMSGDSQIVCAPTVSGAGGGTRAGIKKRSNVRPISDLVPVPDAPSTDNIPATLPATSETARFTITARLMKRFLAFPLKTRLIIVGSVFSTVIMGVSFLVLMGGTVVWMRSAPPTPLSPEATASSGKVETQTFVAEKPETVVHLFDLGEFDVKRGPWPFGKGHVGLGQPITVNKVVFRKGLGAHPPSDGFSSVKYRLDKRFRSFKTSAALADSTRGTSTPLTFQVFGDGKVLWSSEPIQHSKVTQNCAVDVGEIDVLELKVVCPGKNHGAHAVWIEPQLVNK